jgi:uncharacterized protein YecT (DUF1311 family)
MRVIPFLLLLPFMFTVSVSAQTADPTRHPIDSALALCEEANPSTQGMLQCLRDAEQAWDRELNVWYRELQSRVGAKGRPALARAQKAWMAFRDAEFARLTSLYSLTDGTMYLVMHAADRVDLVRRRALDLQSSCDALDSAVNTEP